MKPHIPSILIATIFSSLVVGCAADHELQSYRAYYRATETLLDSLEEHFNWIDKYDPGEALDNYCNVKKQLKH